MSFKVEAKSTWQTQAAAPHSANSTENEHKLHETTSRATACNYRRATGEPMQTHCTSGFMISVSTSRMRCQLVVLGSPSQLPHTQRKNTRTHRISTNGRPASRPAISYMHFHNDCTLHKIAMFAYSMSTKWDTANAARSTHTHTRAQIT